MQRSYQDASGAGEGVCQSLEDASSFKHRLSEQVSHIHLFGSSYNNDSQSGDPSPASPDNATPTSNTDSPQILSSVPSSDLSTP